MTPEDKELLLKDISARLPYKVKVQWITKDTDLLGIIDDIVQIGYDINDYDVAAVEDIKSYLRPMSSMTDEEVKEFASLSETSMVAGKNKITCADISIDAIDWLNAHHFDYRGLIEKCLALEASEGMYRTE